MPVCEEDAVLSDTVLVRVDCGPDTVIWLTTVEVTVTPTCEVVVNDAEMLDSGTGTGYAGGRPAEETEAGGEDASTGLPEVPLADVGDDAEPAAEDALDVSVLEAGADGLPAGTLEELVAAADDVHCEVRLVGPEDEVDLAREVDGAADWVEAEGAADKLEGPVPVPEVDAGRVWDGTDGCEPEGLDVVEAEAETVVALGSVVLGTALSVTVEVAVR